MKINREIRKMLVVQLVLILGGVLVILLIESGIIQIILPPCITREIFGIICPTCGVTRCVTNMINFDFKMAFMYHPSFFIIMLYLFFIDGVYILQTLSKREWLKKIYPNWFIGSIFLVTFIIQYVYRLNMIMNGRGFEFL